MKLINLAPKVLATLHNSQILLFLEISNIKKGAKRYEKAVTASVVFFFERPRLLPCGLSASKKAASLRLPVVLLLCISSEGGTVENSEMIPYIFGSSAEHET